MEYIEYLRNDGQGEGSIALHKAKLRQFFAFCFEETDEKKYRKFIKLLRGNIPSKEISPLDILSAEDVKKLINVATIEQDRAIVSILFESGMRIGELIALKISNVEIKDIGFGQQEVVFHIPNDEGCKTGSRTIPCLEVSSYVQDWLKCHPSLEPNSQFIQLKGFGIRSRIKKLAERAQFKKSINPHNFRHSAITRSAMLGMSDIDISLRYWGCAHSDMLNTYIHLSKQMNSDSYKRTMGMSGEESKIINPIASRCVECGHLIQSGNLCKQCNDNKILNEKLKNVEKINEERQREFEEEKRRLYEENLVQKYESEQDQISLKNELDDKISSLEKMVQNFMKNSKKE